MDQLDIISNLRYKYIEQNIREPNYILVPKGLMNKLLKEINLLQKYTKDAPKLIVYGMEILETPDIETYFLLNVENYKEKEDRKQKTIKIKKGVIQLYEKIQQFQKKYKPCYYCQSLKCITCIFDASANFDVNVD